MNETIQSEYAVIGGICIDPGVIDELAAFLLAEDFTNQHCADVYAQAVQDRDKFDAAIAANILTGQMGEAQAAQFVRDCMDISPTRVNLENHAKKVHQAGRLRRLQAAAQLALMEQTDVQGLADVLAGVAQKYLQEDSGEATTMTLALMDLLQSAGHDDGKRLDTGFWRLDALLKGMRPGQLIVLGARPGVGKSAFLLNLALSVAKVGKVVLFSMEMTAEELAQRGIVTRSKLTMDNLLDEGLNEETLPYATEPAGEISNLAPIILDDRPALSIEQLRARVRLHPDARLIIVDYLQLMQTSGKRDGRNWELGELTRNLKNFSAEVGIPIVVAAQLNRGTDDTQRPGLRSLRDSGEIEAHASKVLLMWKTGVDNLVAIDVAKNRHGRTGVVQFEFSGEHMLFTESAIAYEGKAKTQSSNSGWINRRDGDEY